MTEIKYRIDPKESQPDLLVIRLVGVQKPLTNLQDKEAIEALVKEELQFQRNQTGRPFNSNSHSFDLIHIGSTQVIPLLKLVSNTRRLYFNDKQLIADFYGHVEFYYRLKPITGNGLEISGRLKWRDQDISIHDCDWIGKGKPHWFIRGLSLKIITTDVSWKQLQQAYHHPSWILYGAEKKAFLDTLDPNDPETPRTEVVEGTLEEANRLPDPLPSLVLKDRSGAFADLWMDYGNGNRISFHHPIKEFKSSSGGPPIPRQIEAEKGWEKDLLETDFIRKDVSSSHYYCPIDRVAKSLSFLLELGWHIQDWKGQRVIKENSFDLELKDSLQALLIKGKIRYECHEADISDVIGAFNRRDRFVQLTNGSVGLLPDRWEEQQLQELAEEGEIVGNQIKVKKSHIGSISSLLEHSKLDSSLNELKDKIEQFTHIKEALPGETFRGSLRPYQQQGVNWLSFLIDYGFHGILADDMGLGKTVQVLAFLSRLSQKGPHLIVVPTSLIFNWKNEIEKFLPTYTPYIHQGSKRNKNSEDFGKHSIILTSYTTLRLDLPLFQQFSYQTIILDEAQVVKNAHTQIAQAIYSLQGLFRLSITGTPIENHLNELWAHFHFLIPDLLPDEKSFEADLAAAQADNRYLKRIKKKIAPFILRRKKEEVAKDLPERIDQIVWVEMTEGQRRTYDQFLAGVKSGLLKKIELEGMSKHRIEIFEAILRLRQICCHPALASFSEDEEDIRTSAKFEALMQDLETAVEEGRKVLVYSQFTSMLKLIAKNLKEKSYAYAYLDGSTTNREQVVASFQENPCIPFFLISLKAGGVGLNLTAADYVFLYDPWWNEAVEEQAINRAHRLGRKDTVIAKRFVTVESIEEKMMKLKALKRSLVDSVLDEEVGASDLTLEDLKFLLES